VNRDLPVSEDDYKRFKRLVYGDAVSDWLAVYEAWWTANAEFPTLVLSERLHLAELAVAELTEARLVELFRGTWKEQPGDPIPRDEYKAVLSEWSTWVLSPQEPSVVWCGGDEPPDAAAWQAIIDSF
jgi:hypothetical protein